MLRYCKNLSLRIAPINRMNRKADSFGENEFTILTRNKRTKLKTDDDQVHLCNETKNQFGVIWCNIRCKEYK